jgi:hypothetical protein
MKSGGEPLSLPYRQAHAGRPVGLGHPLEVDDPHQEPLAAVPVLDRFDEPGDRCNGRPRQDRRRDAPGTDRPGRKTGEDRRQADQDRGSGRPPQDESGSHAEGESAGRRPQGGRSVGVEEQEDADPETDRDPGKDPPLLDLDGDVAREPAPAVEEAPVDGRRPRVRQHGGAREAARPSSAPSPVVFSHWFCLSA